MTCIHTIYNFIKDWQTVFVTLPTFGFAWYTWEVNSLMQAMARAQLDYSINKFPKEFFATRLSHLPTCIAAKIMIESISRANGKVVWKHWYKEFESEHIDTRKNRKVLKEQMWNK